MSSIAGGNRFSPITPDNHAGSIWIAALLCLVYSVLVLVVRNHLRWKNYVVDDYLAIAATVCRDRDCFEKPTLIRETGGTNCGGGHGNSRSTTWPWSD